MEAGAATPRAGAYHAALTMRAELALSNEELDAVWFLLQRAAGAAGGGAPPMPPPALRLDFDQFTQARLEARELVGPHAELYFQPSCFLRLARDAGGAVPAPLLLRYLAARSAQLRLRAQLGALANGAASGALSPAALGRWLEAAAPAAALAQQRLPARDWVAAVQARLLLLHGRRGRLLVRDLVASAAMQEVVAVTDLLAEAAAAEGDMGAPGGAASSLAAAQARPCSWAAPAAVARLRVRFSELDVDGDGRLSEQEFLGFSSGTMTRLFIGRLFARHCPAGMDFPAFVAFAAAWEARADSPGAQRYLFAALDARGAGRLSRLDLHALFREVHALWLALGQWADLRIEDVLDEMEDAARPADPGAGITAADLERCGAGGALLGMLADVDAFFAWEQREALLQAGQAGGAGEGGEAGG
eukprot:scaffold17.g521.t1